MDHIRKGLERHNSSGGLGGDKGGAEKLVRMHVSIGPRDKEDGDDLL